MTDESTFGFKDVGRAICEMLRLEKDETIEIQRDRTNPNRLMVIRHPVREGDR